MASSQSEISGNDDDFLDLSFFCDGGRMDQRHAIGGINIERKFVVDGF